MVLLFSTITIPDLVTFAAAALAAVVGAVGVITLRNPVHSALMLIMTFFAIAVLFIEENADFLAAVQVIVYAGAIVVLFLFVIMLLGVDKKEKFRDARSWQLPVALVAAVLVLLEVSLLGHGHWATGAHSVTAGLGSGSTNVEIIARSVFTTYLLPFEATSLLLIVAIIGAVVLARRPDPERLLIEDDERETDSGDLSMEKKEEVNGE